MAKNDKKDKRSKDKPVKDKPKKVKAAPKAAKAPEPDDEAAATPDPVGPVRKLPRARPPARKAAAKKPAARPAKRKPRVVAKGDVTPLADRVVDAIESELDMIETIVGRPNAGPGQRTDAERRARTLASLARTLAELRRLQSVDQPMKASDDRAAGDDEAFRLDLARRLGVTVAEAKAVHPDEEPPV